MAAACSWLGASVEEAAWGPPAGRERRKPFAWWAAPVRQINH